MLPPQADERKKDQVILSKGLQPETSGYGCFELTGSRCGRLPTPRSRFENMLTFSRRHTM